MRKPFRIPTYPTNSGVPLWCPTFDELPISEFHHSQTASRRLRTLFCHRIYSHFHPEIHRPGQIFRFRSGLRTPPAPDTIDPWNLPLSPHPAALKISPSTCSSLLPATPTSAARRLRPRASVSQLPPSPTTRSITSSSSTPVAARLSKLHPANRCPLCA